jgi:hypothetical protein
MHLDEKLLSLELLDGARASHRDKHLNEWGFCPLAAFSDKEAYSFHLQLSKTHTLNVLFSISMPSPSRSWVMVDRPPAQANILFYTGIRLENLHIYLVTERVEALKYHVSKDCMGNDEAQLVAYFRKLGSLTGKHVNPYLYCHPKDKFGRRDENHIEVLPYLRQ